jgi:hypothetical protein
MSKKNKPGAMKLFKEAIKADVKLNTKLYGVTHLLEVNGTPINFDIPKLMATKMAHIKWGNRTGEIRDFFWSRDKETLEKTGGDPSKFKAGECGPMLIPGWTGKNFYSSSRSPLSNFVVLCDPDSTHMYVPTDWYMLTSYNGITPEMLEDMDSEQLGLVFLNENLRDETRFSLESLLKRGK